MAVLLVLVLAVMVEADVRAEVVAVVVLMAGDDVSSEGNGDVGAGSAGARDNGGSVGGDGGSGFGVDYEGCILGDAYQCCPCCKAG